MATDSNTSSQLRVGIMVGLFRCRQIKDMSGNNYMRLTKKEEAWLARFRKPMEAAPKSLNKKISSYTIGDDWITMYDLNKYTTYFDKHPVSSNDIRDQGELVSGSDSVIGVVQFPFSVESTAG